MVSRLAGFLPVHPAAHARPVLSAERLVLIAEQLAYLVGVRVGPWPVVWLHHATSPNRDICEPGTGTASGISPGSIWKAYRWSDSVKPT